MLKCRSWLAGLWLSIGVIFSAQGALPDFTRLVEKASPTVVNISTIKHATANPDAIRGEIPDLLRHFFERKIPEYDRQPPGRSGQGPSSLGSGFIVSSDGYILTNHHVVKEADEILIRLSDRREMVAQLVGADPRSDLALLKVEAKGLPAVEFGKSDELKVGAWVLAIGSPFGFDYSVTAGIVSAKGRSLPNENYVPFIQTDVAINPGNSGGPLFNLKGEVVGINSQIYTRSGGFMGVSFAIPIDVALDVVEQLKTKGEVSRGWLGVVIQEVNKQLAESFGLDKPQGALVAQLVPGGPAEAGGLKSGDIIVAFNGREVVLSSDLPHQVGQVKPGERAKIKVVRNAKLKVLTVTIGRLPENDAKPLARADAETGPVNILGVVVVDLSEQQRASVGDGVMVQRLEHHGAGALSGLVRGDVITMIYGQRIRSKKDINSIAESLPRGRAVPMQIIRRGVAMFIPLRIPQ